MDPNFNSDCCRLQLACRQEHRPFHGSSSVHLRWFVDGPWENGPSTAYVSTSTRDVRYVTGTRERRPPDWASTAGEVVSHSSTDNSAASESAVPHPHVVERLVRLPSPSLRTLTVASSSRLPRVTGAPQVRTWSVRSQRGEVGRHLEPSMSARRSSLSVISQVLLLLRARCECDRFQGGCSHALFSSDFFGFLVM